MGYSCRGEKQYRKGAVVVLPSIVSPRRDGAKTPQRYNIRKHYNECVPLIIETIALTLTVLYDWRCIYLG